MDEATYASMPATLTVRELRFSIEERGCRTHEIVMATTLLDPSTYSRDDIADLYHQRWHVEMRHPNYSSSASLYQGGVAA
jgi:hypothetical protein